VLTNYFFKLSEVGINIIQPLIKVAIFNAYLFLNGVKYLYRGEFVISKNLYLYISNRKIAILPTRISGEIPHGHHGGSCFEYLY
jgi:hypothetical protein